MRGSAPSRLTSCAAKLGGIHMPVCLYSSKGHSPPPVPEVARSGWCLLFVGEDGLLISYAGEAAALARIQLLSLY